MVQQTYFTHKHLPYTLLVSADESPLTVFLLKHVIHQWLSSIQSNLLFKAIFHKWLISFKCCLILKILFHDWSFYQRFSSVLLFHIIRGCSSIAWAALVPLQTPPTPLPPTLIAWYLNNIFAYVLHTQIEKFDSSQPLLIIFSCIITENRMLIIMKEHIAVQNKTQCI